MSRFQRKNFNRDVPVVSEEEARKNPNPKQARIVVPEGPEGREIMERITTPRRCGLCRHFNLKRGQEILNDPRDPFVVRLRQEMELRSLSEQMDWSMAGLCEYFGDHITTSISPARASKGQTDSEVDYREKDKNVACEGYSPGDSDGKNVKSFRAVKGSRTVGTD